MTVRIPSRLQWLRGIDSGSSWLKALPGIVAACAETWSLRLGTPFEDSYVSIVVPARLPDDTWVVLKVQWPHRESTHEAAALRAWGGDGAVRILDEDPTRHALLVEHCHPGTHLREEGADATLDVFVALLPRLWVPAAAPFEPLSAEANVWVQELPAKWEHAARPFEQPLLDAAIYALVSLSTSQEEAVLLHQDLHADNVLAAEREPWLAIDPKPLVGERAFSVAPIVRDYTLGHSREHVLHRLDRLCAGLDLDRERARGWAFGQTLAGAFEGEDPLGRHVETARWLYDAG